MGLQFMKPIHKFNGGLGATLCNSCSVIISTGLTEDLYCEKCKQKNLLIDVMEADEKDGLYKTNNMTQQTAVDWLIEQLVNLDKQLDGRRKSDDSTVIKINPTKIYEQAKQMEKEQIETAWRNGDNDSMYSPKELDAQAEQYYNKIYNK